MSQKYLLDGFAWLRQFRPAMSAFGEESRASASARILTRIAPSKGVPKDKYPSVRSEVRAWKYTQECLFEPGWSETWTVWQSGMDLSGPGVSAPGTTIRGEHPISARYPLGQDDVFHKVPVEAGKRRFMMVRPKLSGWRYTRPLPTGVTSDRLIPNYTAWHWMALVEGKKAQVSASTEIMPHVLSRHGLREFWSLWSRMRVTTSSRFFAVDSTGTTVPVYNTPIEAFRVVSTKKDKSQTLRPDLESFEPDGAELYQDRTVQVELGYKGHVYDVHPLPHHLPWNVFSDRDYEEITRKAHILAHMRDMRRSYRTAWNVVDDVVQDACIQFAGLLKDSDDWEVMYRSAAGYPVAFWFVPKRADMSAVDLFEQDGEIVGFDDDLGDFVVVNPDNEPEEGWMVTRSTLYAWSVKTALKRYGLDKLTQMTAIQGETTSTLSEGQIWVHEARTRPSYLNTSYLHSTASNPADVAAWVLTWQSGSNYPILAKLLDEGMSGRSATKAALWKEATVSILNRDKVTSTMTSVVKGNAADEYARLQADLHETRQTWRGVYEPTQRRTDPTME